jgi:hypothetical protein
MMATGAEVGFLMAVRAASLLLDFREEFDGVRMGIYNEKEKAGILDEFVRALYGITVRTKETP